MKKFLSLVLAATLLLLIPGCQSGGEAAAPSPAESPDSTPETPAESAAPTESAAPAEPEEASSSPAPTASGESNVLIAYFSWAENAVLEGDVDAVTSPSVLAPGNVQQLAGWVQEETGGDLFSIQVTDPYPSDWDACLERANQERGDDARPALVRRVENLDQYDVVFLGYPNWWYGVPMALLTFLEENDLSGKQVYLFCSHGTGGLARSVEILTAAAPEARFSDNVFDCYEEDAASSQEEIQSWVAELGLTTGGAEAAQARTIEVRSGETAVTYALEDNAAADALLAQLPLTIEIEDYSTNEKIFYPPQALETAGAPAASGGAGVLAYYEPWGDVVLFYDGFSENASLFALGRAVSGAESIRDLTGTVTVAVAEG